MSDKIKPSIQLSGEDGNAFVMVGRAERVITKHNREHADKPESMIDIDEFRRDALGGDYDHVIQTIMKYFEVS